MNLENEKCQIEIKIDETYTVESTDNKYYDMIFNPDCYTHSEHYKVFSIVVNLNNEQYSIALVGDYYSYDTDCALLDNTVLTVLQNDTITQIDIIDKKIVNRINFNCFGCNFGIYKIQTGYVIYGEIEITMLDMDFNKKWSFSGKDIFVSTTNKMPFKLKENSICLYDFQDNYYEINFDGQLINKC